VLGDQADHAVRAFARTLSEELRYRDVLAAAN
jgi:hypothetical protein